MMTTTAQTRDSDSNILDRDETNNLIASDKVEGTTVFDSKGEKLGTIRNVMIGKMDGKSPLPRHGLRRPFRDG